MNPKTPVLNAIHRIGQGEFPIQLDVTDRVLQQLGVRWGFEPLQESRFTVLRNHLVFAKAASRQIADEGVSGNMQLDA